MEQELVVRSAAKEDVAGMAAIYNHYIRNTVITFELDELSDADFADRLASHPPELPWLAIEHDSALIGYCYAAPWKQRRAYGNSVETSIYLDEKVCGNGLGKRAYAVLLSKLGTYHTVIGGIALPNEASIALHEALGFRKVAHFYEVGYKFDRWIDVGYWQLMPEQGRN
jgi:L-amino acid N-acyltransferase YncA